MKPLIGIYEKALPLHLEWSAMLRLTAELGFDFLEMSVDESDERLARLDWSASQRKDLRRAIEEAQTPILDLCLSAHRKFALGSADEGVRAKALDIFHRAIDFAAEIGIRIIQLAGYYVYYEPEDEHSLARYRAGLEVGLAHAERTGVMLALENVDGVHVNSISRAMRFVNDFNSPWFQLYPDIGNLSEQGLNVSDELEAGKGHIVAVHVKDVVKGQVRRIPFGKGIVDFVAAFQKLKSMAFKGPVLIEMWNDDAADSTGIVSESLRFVKEKMRLGGYSE
ncbi:MAG TPA: L-ribulose-5-phosphate 3-epimerase [Anaerolineaceae bacterium]|nr:L-ribulose-5-phosphate 3-epimerase [Anaerolineaceae bacterium]